MIDDAGEKVNMSEPARVDHPSYHHRKKRVKRTMKVVEKAASASLLLRSLAVVAESCCGLSRNDHRWFQEG